MSGRWLTLFCWIGAHAEPLWTVRAYGSGWTCPDCQRFRASRVLSRAA